eukprot:TRINITY_DN32827_c0_g1_i1.p1 TRINITY_DN32827_c0_g1~~TRINITY_DN32827_c0_g1_i1.p1  ORF type:complete len:1617 (+),score=314.15 TRINITY_DN32827_c0_g1_i1:549-4853(+)
MIGGMVAMGPLKLCALMFDFSFIPLNFLVGVRWLCERRSMGGVLTNTLCWRALSGHQYAVLDRRVDLAALAKAITHRGRQGRGWFCSNVSPILLGMVRVDEGNEDVPDVPFCLGDEGFEPDEYVLTGLTRKEPDGTDESLIKDLQAALGKTKKFSDNKVNKMLNPGPEETAGSAPAAAKAGAFERLVDRVKKVQFGRSKLIASLRRINYVEGLLDHWAVSAAWCVVLCAFLALPVLHLFSDIEMARRATCGGSDDITSKDVFTFHGAEICGGSDSKPCVHVCKSLLSFMEALHGKFHTSNAELLIVFVLLPVSIWAYSVRVVKTEHNRRENIYFRGLQQPKKAIYEVTKLKGGLESVFKMDFLSQRMRSSLQAWLGADAQLSACGPISHVEFDLTATKGYNDCFKQIMLPVTDLQSSISCEKSEDLMYGVGYLDDPMEVQSAWNNLKYRNSLGGDSDRNYKILFDLKICSKDSYDLFKEWCKKEYKEQFEYIMNPANENAQDLGKCCHLKENTPIHDILLPRGFSLTHVYVQAMPEDFEPVQLEARGIPQEAKAGGTAPSPADAFWSSCDRIMSSIKHESGDDEDCYDEFPLFARFALSEQYFNEMESAEITRLCPDAKFANQLTRPSFTEFVDCLLTPSETSPPDCPDDKSYLFYTGISVFMGDESPLRALLAAISGFISALMVYLQTAALAMVIPALRFAHGGCLFPEPFSLWMFLNTISTWYLLSNFFVDFNTSRARLGLIGKCLQEFEMRSIAPTAPTAKAASTPAPEATTETETPAGQEASAAQDATAAPSAEAAQAAEAAAARQSKKSEDDTRPFDLVVTDKTTPYDPTDQYWIDQWSQKHDNLAKWHMTVGNLRVFVSTSRLTAQATLVAAVFVVAFLLLMSLQQLNSGQGPQMLSHAVQSARAEAQQYAQKTAAHLQEAVTEGRASISDLHGQIGDALRGLKDSVTNGEQSRRLSEEHDTWMGLESATRSLHEELEPARAALHGALLRQHDALVHGHRLATEEKARRASAEGMLEMLEGVHRRLGENDDMSAGEQDAANQLNSVKKKAQAMAQNAKEFAKELVNATKTQIFTVAMVLFVLLYSVPLMWNIVQVNGYFDRHDDILIKQKELHRVRHNRRLGGDGATTQSDPGVSRYESMLTMSTQSAKKTKERFPLKLFGFVISTNLLGTWIALAGAPLVSQAKQMAPVVTTVACSWLEHSAWVESVQEQADKTAPKLHLHVSEMIHNNLCVPLRQMVAQKVNDVGDTGRRLSVPGVPSPPAVPASNAASRSLLAVDVGSRGREEGSSRFLRIPDLSRILQRWDRTTAALHPALPASARLAVARTSLAQLGRDGDRLLVAAPRSVQRAFEEAAEELTDSSDGAAALAPFWSAFGAVRPHLEHAAPSLTRAGCWNDARTGVEADVSELAAEAPPPCGLVAGRLSLGEL